MRSSVSTGLMLLPLGFSLLFGFQIGKRFLPSGLNGLPGGCAALLCGQVLCSGFAALTAEGDGGRIFGWHSLAVLSQVIDCRYVALRKRMKIKQINLSTIRSGTYRIVASSEAV